MTTKMVDANNFLDLKGLNSIRQQSKADDKDSKDAALQAAAKQFEAIFMQMLMKSMRSAQDVLAADSPFNSESTKFYRDMHDQQMSLEMSNNGSLGLSELIVRQLGGDSENFTPHNIVRNDGGINARGISTQQAKLTDPLTTTLAANNSRQSTDGLPISQSSPVFEQPKDFVTALSASAKQVEQKLNIPFEVVIAQAALETGWGQKIIRTESGSSSNNLFNIKADSRWQGDKTNKETLEFEQGAMVKKKEPFRVYNSLTESVNDFVNFLSSNERYQSALKKVDDVEQFLHGLQKAGYATDPKYAEKIMGTLRTVNSLLSK